MSTLFDSESRRQFIMYCLVGVFNTLSGLLCTFLLIWLGVSIYLANFVGYAIGCCVSYVLNSKYTFTQQYSKTRVIKFFIGIMIAYVINVLAIYLTLLFNPDAKYLAQLVGNVFYTILGFLINKFWVME